jgi:polyhydroxyalkanoate synthesis regulator phasin
MKSKFLTATLLASAIFTSLAAVPAMAQNPNIQGVDNAQRAIGARIQQGMQSGHITPSEAQALLRRDREIDAREARFMSDGRATPQERQQLRADVAALSAEVERMIANGDVVRQGSLTPGIDKATYDIGQRIDEGLRSRRISQREARNLHSQQRAIERHEAAYKSDGVVTQQERRQLRGELDALRAQVERLINPRG